MHSSITHVELNDLLQLQVKAKKIHLACRQRVTTQRSGERASTLQGRGMDFSEFRHYIAGDDTTRIDWRVTARTGKAHIRVYREERERPVFIVIDQGETMQFATRVAFKSVIAARAAALFAWAAFDNHDRVGGFIFGGDNVIESRPKSGKMGILSFFQSLANYSSDTYQPQLTQTLLRLQSVAKSGSLIIICSDFAEFNRETQQLLHQLAKRCDIIMTFISDPLEQHAPPAGLYAVSDGQQQFHINTHDQQWVSAYQQSFLDAFTEVKRYCEQQKIHFISLLTTDDVAKRLEHYTNNQSQTQEFSHGG